MFETIVVPIDGTTPSKGALSTAVMIARAGHASIRIVTVAPSEADVPASDDRVHEAAQLVPRTLNATTEVIVDDDPVNALLEIERLPANVLCFESHDRNRLATRLFHAVGSSVVRQSTDPFIVVGLDGGPTASSDVVVALDGVSDPDPLLSTAVAWARRLEAPLRVVTVYEDVPEDLRDPSHYTRRHGPPTDPNLYLASMRSRVEALGPARVDVAAVEDAVSVTAGLEHHLRERPALLLVVGGGSHWPGSVVRGLVQGSAPPLLVVPPMATRDTNTPRSPESKTEKGSSNMSLSDQLSALAARTKELEDRVAAAQGKGKADLEQDVKEARETAQAQSDELRRSAAATKEKLSAWWDNVQRSWNENLDAVRKNVAERRKLHDLQEAQRAADQAADDASFAVAYARAAIEEAAYAVLDADLAQREALELANS